MSVHLRAARCGTTSPLNAASLPARKVRVLVALCALSAGALTGCGGGVVQPEGRGASMPRPKPNFFLRTGFDTDPSTYLGRFVPAGTPPEAIDDANAIRTTCSQFFKVRKVGGGGVRYDEYFAASQSASAGLNLPEVSPVTAQASGQAGQVVRVQYTLIEKWVVDLDDPAGYSKCCAEADNHCSPQIIGEFLSGTGRLLYADSSASDASVGMAGNGLEAKDGFIWRQAVDFPQPVFFAFKLTPSQAVAGTPSTQANWDTKVPAVGHGKYFVGVSEWLASEAVARDGALLDARRQAIKYLGETISQKGSGGTAISGNGADFETRIQSGEVFERASRGVARFVKDQDWKVEEDRTPTGRRYRAKVLAFIGNDQVDAAAAELKNVL